MLDQLKRRYYYESFFYKTRKLRKNFPFYRIKSIEETINEIIIEKKNISRFGDGEFRLLFDNFDIGFQSRSPEMKKRLREVITSTLPNLIVALPETFSAKNRIMLRHKYWWLNFINNVGVMLVEFLDPKRTYGNSFISRFYLIYENQKNTPNIITKLKKIWDGHEVLIVEGKFSRLGVGNDLFENAKSIERILCPPKNAFEKYDEILSIIRENHRGRLVILALGPTATILAHDLAKEQIWALDMGHVDLEYMWYLQGTDEKIPIIGRLVNETVEQLSLEIPEEFRQKYESTIIKEL